MKTSPGARLVLVGSRPVVRAFFLALLMGFPAAMTPCAGEEYRSAADGILKMNYADGRVTMETRDAPLNKVLQEFARLADLNILSDGPLEERVTVYISDLPTDAAARKILRGKDLSFLYRAGETEKHPEDYPLREIRIYEAQGTTGIPQAFSYGTSAASIPRQATRAPTQTRPAARTPARARTLEDRTPRDEAGSPADSFLSGLLGGNLEALDGMAERLKQEHPEAEAQIEQFLQALEEAKSRAVESGGPRPSPEELGGLGDMMQRMMLLRNEER